MYTVACHKYHFNNGKGWADYFFQKMMRLYRDKFMDLPQIFKKPKQIKFLHINVIKESLSPIFCSVLFHGSPMSVLLRSLEIKLVMGPGQKFLTRVGSIFCGVGRVSHLWFGFEFGKFPLKLSNFSIFSLRVKKSLRVGSKSTWVKVRSASYLPRVKRINFINSTISCKFLFSF